MRALALRKHRARLLVFGCGRDSGFWARVMNRHGTTVFLEDNPQWARFDRNLTAHVVRYRTAPMHAWRQRLQQSDRSLSLPARFRDALEMDGVPAGLFEQWWDVVLVDAPNGGQDAPYYSWVPDRIMEPYAHPGRLAPIYQAARLLARQRAQRPCARVDVFVHDFNRWTEKEASLLFLAPHARLANYEGIVQDGRPDTKGSPNGTYMAWFHAP